MSSAGDQGKFCVDCKHMIPGPWADTPAALATCRRAHPLVDGVSGVTVYPSCVIARTTPCYAGKLWESKYGDARP